MRNVNVKELTMQAWLVGHSMTWRVFNEDDEVDSVFRVRCLLFMPFDTKTHALSNFTVFRYLMVLPNPIPSIFFHKRKRLGDLRDVVYNLHVRIMIGWLWFA